MFSVQCLEIARNVVRVIRADAHLRHRAARRNRLRMLNPFCHVVGTVLQTPGNEDPIGDAAERRPDAPLRIIDTGNGVACPASILPY